MWYTFKNQQILEFITGDKKIILQLILVKNNLKYNVHVHKNSHVIFFRKKPTFQILLCSTLWFFKLECNCSLKNAKIKNKINLFPHKQIFKNTEKKTFKLNYHSISPNYLTIKSIKIIILSYFIKQLVKVSGIYYSIILPFKLEDIHQF
jgi:hypothetical protein